MGATSHDPPMPNRTVVLPPRVDIDNIAEVEAMLRAALAEGGVVDFDCAELRFVDSAGAKMLFQLADYAHVRRCTVYFANLHDGPLRVLRLLGIFDLYQSRSQ
jgi:anti-anti-sigma regulatory factor